MFSGEQQVEHDRRQRHDHHHDDRRRRRRGRRPSPPMPFTRLTSARRRPVWQSAVRQTSRRYLRPNPGREAGHVARRPAARRPWAGPRSSGASKPGRWKPPRTPRAPRCMTKASTRATAVNSCGRDLLAELAGGVQRPGQRDVLHHRHAAPPRRARGACAATSPAPLATTRGAPVRRVVLQRDGDVGGVDQQRRRPRRRRPSSGCATSPGRSTGGAPSCAGRPRSCLCSCLIS